MIREEQRVYEEGRVARRRSPLRRSSPYQSWNHAHLDIEWHRGWDAEHERLTSAVAGQEQGNG